MTTRQLNRVCHMAAELASLPKWVAPHALPQLRHPSARAEHRHSRDPGPARACQARHHGALHASGNQHPDRDTACQFSGSPRISIDARRSHLRCSLLRHRRRSPAGVGPVADNPEASGKSFCRAGWPDLHKLWRAKRRGDRGYRAGGTNRRRPARTRGFRNRADDPEIPPDQSCKRS